MAPAVQHGHGLPCLPGSWGHRFPVQGRALMAATACITPRRFPDGRPAALMATACSMPPQGRRKAPACSMATACITPAA